MSGEKQDDPNLGQKVIFSQTRQCFKTEMSFNKKIYYRILILRGYCALLIFHMDSLSCFPVLGNECIQTLYYLYQHEILLSLPQTFIKGGFHYTTIGSPIFCLNFSLILFPLLVNSFFCCFYFWEISFFPFYSIL